ncbi:hypothetical protein uan_079 [Pseudomonas phage UAntarctica]|nr:hypothetical protein uan_079 [Pseudomonas phage UAntarctica]
MLILNQKIHGVPRGAVYVGRPSEFGNPFVVGKDGQRGECRDKYREWVKTQPALLKKIRKLAGKDLVCWCWPDACHAEVIMEIANPGWDKDQAPF